MKYDALFLPAHGSGLDLEELVSVNAGWTSLGCGVQLARLGVRVDYDARTDPAVPCDRDAVADSCIDPDEAVFRNIAEA